MRPDRHGRGRRTQDAGREPKIKKISMKLIIDKKIKKCRCVEKSTNRQDLLRRSPRKSRRKRRKMWGLCHHITAGEDGCQPPIFVEQNKNFVQFRVEVSNSSPGKPPFRAFSVGLAQNGPFSENAVFESKNHHNSIKAELPFAKLFRTRRCVRL